MVSGDYNTAVGYGAANGTTAGGATTTGSNNTAIGASSLANYTSGNTNTVLGYNSGYSITSGSNNVIIGGYTGAAAPISQTGSNWIVLSDGAGTVRQVIDPSGNVQSVSGANVVYAPAPASYSAAASLTNADLRTGIIIGTGSGGNYTLTMPLGTTLETLVSWSGTDLGFDFSIMNNISISGQISLSTNTGVTNGGSISSLNINIGASGRFRIRRTAANTFTVYRIS